MNRLEVIESQKINGLKTIRRKIFGDSRGFFSRIFDLQELQQIGWENRQICQINQSFTQQIGSVRGIHFQTPPFNDSKIVTCIKGKVLDIAVDIRKNSPTFLQYQAVELSENNATSFWIPEGFAHGFQTLSDDCMLLYIHSQPFSAESDCGLNPLDPKLNIAWQLPISCMSEKDKNRKSIDETNFQGI